MIIRQVCQHGQDYDLKHKHSIYYFWTKGHKGIALVATWMANRVLVF